LQNRARSCEPLTVVAAFAAADAESNGQVLDTSTSTIGSMC